jgi:3-isopropylmalate/(R)-2-methylmalate dehydratase large subunit
MPETVIRPPQTLFDKIWDSHIVAQEPGAPAVLYVDLHLVHEVTSPQAFDGLNARGLPVRRPDLTLATLDHSTPTQHLSLPLLDQAAAKQLRRLQDNCREHGIKLFDLDSDQRGIVHVIGPELGATQPGMTIVCGDSHTATHGAFGALAFGIGTSEVEHVLASQCLLQNKPKTFQVQFEGQLAPGVTAKDMILALIARIGIGGGTGSVIEYAGSAVRSLDMEERMTLCNMSIEAGARAGMIAPDDTTIEYLAGRPYAPQGAQWETAVEYWRGLPSDQDSVFDQVLTLDVSGLQPMITYGTNPGMAIPIGGLIPDPLGEQDLSLRLAQQQALSYMDLTPGQTLAGHPVDVVFIGSCTNSRITDLRAAASILKGRKLADGVRLLVVPGSESIRRQAEAEGLDKVFREAGGEWRFSGCSMCIAMNGDDLQPGQYAVSTSNRNFVGRQGKGSRTFLASPITAAAAALTGRVTDPRMV